MFRGSWNLEGLRQRARSFILQAVPPRHEHPQSERRPEGRRPPVTLGQSFSQDLCAAETAVSHACHQSKGKGASPAHLSSADSHPAVVEAQLLQGVAGGALQQLLDALHAVRPEGVVAQIQLSQPGTGAHYRAAKRHLREKGGREKAEKKQQ